jgi:type I restriction enzyme, S subunit
MSSDWASLTVGDLVRLGEATIRTGPFGSQLHSHDYVAAGIPVIPTEAIGRGRILDMDVPKVNLSKAAELSRHRLRRGDILFARRGAQATGLSAIVDERYDDALCGTGALLLRTQSARVDPDYLAMFLSSDASYRWLRAHAVGAVMPNLNTHIIKALPLVLPSIEEQRELAEFFGALDDRIALLRETNATLEAIAQALFKSWFVDFDPVRAKSQGLAPTGMDEATAALFPSSFEESALGLVPKGWQVQALDEIATFLNGLALQKFPPSDESWLPVIKIAQLRKGDSVGADRAGRNLKLEYIIQNGDVLFSWSGSLEVELWCGGEGALNQHLFKVTSKAFAKWFYLRWTRHHLNHFRQVAASKATTMGHIQRAHLSEAKVLVPSAQLLGAMDAFFAPLLARSVQNELQAQTLATLRDTLLPRLISGQLRLPEAQVEEALDAA